MRRLADAFPKTIIWGSDTPYYYFIRRYYDGNGQLQDVRLPCEPDEEARLLRRLDRERLQRIAWRNTLALGLRAAWAQRLTTGGYVATDFRPL